MNRLTVILGLMLIVFTSSQIYAQLPVKIFSTPDLRAELERRRLGLVPVEPEPSILDVIADTLNDAEEAELVYSLEGTMQRSDGTSIVWLNGVATDESSLPAHIQLVKPVEQGRLRITSPTNQEFEIMPGQVLNLTTGTIYESYQWKEIEAQRRLQELAAAAAESGISLDADLAEP